MRILLIPVVWLVLFETPALPAQTAGHCSNLANLSLSGASVRVIKTESHAAGTAPRPRGPAPL